MQTMTKISTAKIYPTLATTDIRRAMAFYADTLGYATEMLPGATATAMVHCGGDTGISLYERPTQPNCDATAAVLVVDDLRAAMTDLRGRGVVFEEYDLPYLKTKDGIADDGTSLAAWFKDPDGNVLSLVQM